tara:strand:+ start:470 stop:679 length:210 start_codon:yes stop_codon:yes gene_type:complete
VGGIVKYFFNVCGVFAVADDLADDGGYDIAHIDAGYGSASEASHSEPPNDHEPSVRYASGRLPKPTPLL